jgi:hypothetical protein
MAGFPGDMTQEDIEKSLLDGLKEQLASATGASRDIVISAETAAVLAKKLGDDTPPA